MTAIRAASSAAALLLLAACGDGAGTAAEETVMSDLGGDPVYQAQEAPPPVEAPAPANGLEANEAEANGQAAEAPADDAEAAANGQEPAAE